MKATVKEKYKFENIPTCSSFKPHVVTLTSMFFKLTDLLICPMKYKKGKDAKIDPKIEQKMAIRFLVMVICAPCGRHTLRYLSRAITSSINADINVVLE
jgi:hypothetical protein